MTATEIRLHQDRLAMQAMCIGTPPPQKPGSFIPELWSSQLAKGFAQGVAQSQTISTQGVAQSQTISTQMMMRRVEEAVLGFLPDACKEHVYDFKKRVTEILGTQCSEVLCKWTFYNDLSITLKMRMDRDAIFEDSIAAMRKALTPVCEDFEAWQAEAIMMCEAGEDVWERPKYSTFSHHSHDSSLGLQGSSRIPRLFGLK